MKDRQHALKHLKVNFERKQNDMSTQNGGLENENPLPWCAHSFAWERKTALYGPS